MALPGFWWVAAARASLRGLPGLRPAGVNQLVEVRAKNIGKLGDSLRGLRQEVEDSLALAERTECDEVEPVLVRFCWLRCSFLD